MIFWVINAVLLLILGFLLLLLSMFWPPDSPWAPWWKTSKEVARAVCRLAKITAKDNVYELGSGDGTFLSIMAKEFGAKGTGVEIDPLRFIVSTLFINLIRVQDRVSIIRKNFYNVDISKASVIYVYLVPRVLQKLKSKFFKELKSGTRVVSYRYKIKLPLTAYDKLNDLYLYEIK